MSTLQTFKDPSGEVIYPATHAKATLIERGEDIITLEDYIEEVDDTLDTCVKKDFISAEIFDATKTYTRSKLVWYENKLYIFTHSKTAGAWDSSKVQEVTDLDSTFQTQNLRTPLLVGSLIQGDLEGALGGINNIVSNNSDSINTLNTNVSNLTTNKQDKLTAGINISFNGNTINATYPIVVNGFDKANLFSTTEKIVGCWTDGRPIYQKTIDCGAMPNNTTKSIAHGINNLKNLVKFYGIYYNNGTGAFVGQSWYNNKIEIDDIYIQNKDICIYANYDASSFYCYATLQYTKTTDAANSFKYADENDYSTTEHIIGTWIDGKPLYQKTIDFGALPNATTKTIAHGIANKKLIVEIKSAIHGGLNSTSTNLMASSSYAEAVSSDTRVQFHISGNDLVCITNRNASSFSAYVTLKYTKTTD